MVYVSFTHEIVENGVGHWIRSYDGLLGQKHNLQCFVDLVKKTPSSADDIIMVEIIPLSMTELESSS